MTIADPYLREEMATKSIADIISRAKIKLMMYVPYWGILLSHVEVHVMSDEKAGDKKTAWTNGENIWFNETFFSKLTIREFHFIMLHELMHIAFLHIWRSGAKDPRRHNLATDYWIHDVLVEETKNNPIILAIPDFNRIFEVDVKKDPSKASSILYDPKFHNMSSDEIYAFLLRAEKPDKGDQGGQQGQGQGSGKSQGKSGAGQDQQNPLSDDLDYDNATSPDSGETQEDKARRMTIKWQGIQAQAIDAAKKAGNMPGHLDRWFDKMLEQKIDYKVLLAIYLQSFYTDFSFKRYHRPVYYESEIFLPTIDGEKLNVALVIDTSGSMSDDQIAETISNCQQIMGTFDWVEGTLIGHDHEVHDWKPFDTASGLPRRFEGGGGGTDFHSVFKECEKRKYTPDIMIWFTDGYATWPDKHDKWPIIVMAVNTSYTEKDFPDWVRAVHKIDID